MLRLYDFPNFIFAFARKHNCLFAMFAILILQYLQEIVL